MTVPALEPHETSSGAPTAGVDDFDLHGLAGIRLLDADPADAATVARQLGAIRRQLDREPEIVVRFADRVAPRPARYLGIGEAGYVDDDFLVLENRKMPVRVRLPLADAGGRIEIVCRRGVPAVPLLVPILNLTLLAKDVLPLHASAFVYRGTGIVTTGWSKGGKTEALLAFAANGARYVGDEWVYVPADGARVYGIPEPVRLWHWHLRQLPEARRVVGRRARARLGAVRLASSLDRLPLGTTYSRARPLLRRQLHVDVAPERLFASARQPSCGFDRLFLVSSHEAPAIAVRPIGAEEVARRMVFSLQYERLDFLAHYLKFRFAFPEAANPVVERAEELERDLLRRVLAGKAAYAVDHPYPVSIPALFEAMRPHCE